MNLTQLDRLLKLAFPMDEAADAGGAGAGGGGAGAGADAGADKGGDKGLTLRDELEASMEISEKGEDSADLSTAARTLAAARKGKAPIDKVDEKALAESARVAAENKKKAEAEKAAAEEKAKREAELAKLPPEERAKREAEEKRKAEEVAAAAKLEAPAHWPAAARELFAKQSPEVRTFLLDRHKAMEADYTKKMQELGPTRRLSETLDELFKPHDEYLRQAGMTREQAIRELVGWKERLDKDAAGALRYLAQISGVDLKKLVEGGGAAAPLSQDDVQKAVDSRLAEERKREASERAQREQEARLAEVTKFAEEVDAQGNRLRPHFDEVAREVGAIIHASKQDGRPTVTLQEAYDRAVFANPTTREKVLAAKDAERRRKEDEDRKQKAEAARKASAADVSGQGAAAVAAASKGSVREDLEAAFAEYGDRV